jgi:hypothetical protein
MAKSIIISRQDMHDFLTAKGFALIPNLPGTKELVYGQVVRPGICLRVYTSVVGEASRDNGEDAIRCVLVTKVDNEVKFIGSDRRVHRVQGWRNNLQDRLNNWPQQLGPDCPKCGAATVQRRSKRGPFWGCSRYPVCRSIQPIASQPQARQPAPAAPPAAPQVRLDREDIPFGGLIDSDD